MASVNNLKFVFVTPNSNLAAKYMVKIENVLKHLGYFTQRTKLKQLGDIGSLTSFYYKTVVVCHNPTIVDCLKYFNINGKDVLIQLILENKIKGDFSKWHWPYYQTVDNLSKLYTNVFGLDVSNDVGVNVRKDRILAHCAQIYRICGGGFNLSSDMKIGVYPKYTAKNMEASLFDVGLIIPTGKCDDFKPVKNKLLKRYGKNFTLINNITKIRECRLIVVLSNNFEKNQCIYPDELYDLILYNVPLVTNLSVTPFKKILDSHNLKFTNKNDVVKVTENVLSKYDDYLGVPEMMINVFVYGYNFNHQLGFFVKWIEGKLTKEIYSTVPLMNKIGNVKTSFITSNFSKNLNSVFDKIYVINLEQDVKKRENIKRMLEKHNIHDYEIFKAIDGKEHSEILANIQLQHMEQITSDNNEDDHLLRTEGELGCLLSHLSIIQDAKDNEHNSICIFEDDAILAHDSVNTFLYNYNKLIKPWDMIYFGVSKVNFYAKNSVYSEGFKEINHCFGTFAYGINIRAYDKIISTISNLLKPLDVYYAKEVTLCDEIVALVCDPYLAIADTTTSGIRDSIDMSTAAQHYNWNLKDFDVKVVSAPSSGDGSSEGSVEIEKVEIEKVEIEGSEEADEADDSEFEDDVNRFIVLVKDGIGMEKVGKQDYDKSLVKIYKFSDGLKGLINVIGGISDVRDRDIIVIVDNGQLIGTKVFKRINSFYVNGGNKVLLTYGGDTDNMAQECPTQVKVFNKYRDDKWIFGGLHTFKYMLWKGIKAVDFKNENGNYWDWSVAKMAYMYPMLEMSNGRFAFIEKNIVKCENLAGDGMGDGAKEIKRMTKYGEL